MEKTPPLEARSGGFLFAAMWPILRRRQHPWPPTAASGGVPGNAACARRVRRDHADLADKMDEVDEFVSLTAQFVGDHRAAW